MSRRRLWLALAVVVAGAAIFGGWALWRAGGALREARAHVAAGSSFRFTARPISAVLPAGLQFVGAPAAFADAQVFQGHLFIAGPTGLIEYDQDGAVIIRYRVGAELPPAPLISLAVGQAGDSQGPELWIATGGEGLLAFDGRNFRQIRADEPHLRKLTAILPLDTGRIVMGTEKAGLLVYDGRELKPFHPSLMDLPVTALAGTEESLWIGTLDRGLLHWKAGALDATDGVVNEALPDRQILSLARMQATESETIYAGTAMGVAEIRDGKFTRVLAPGYFAQSLLAADGQLWVGTLEEGMLALRLDAHLERGSQLGQAKVCPDCSIHKILRIGNDVYALAENGLWRGSEAVLNSERNPGDAPLVDRTIAALKMDGTGRLWIGYFDRGLQILDPGGTRGDHFEDDHLFCVNRIANDPARGVTAVATANGLVMFDAATARRRVIGQDEGLIANQVTDVLLRPDGTAGAATPAGVSFINSTGINSIYAFEGLVNNHAYALASDGARTLVGTLGGLSILDGEMVKTSFTTSNSALRHNWITAITRVGNDWFVGTYGAGVLKLDALGHWQSFNEMRGSIEINTNSIVATGTAVYAGTLDRGLAVYNLSSDRWNFWTAGLPSLNVTAVEARGGMLYLGTDNGLVKIPESTVTQPGGAPIPEAMAPRGIAK
jgi:ligand-binding sensor domain-containing protein